MLVETKKQFTPKGAVPITGSGGPALSGTARSPRSPGKLARLALSICPAWGGRRWPPSPLPWARLRHLGVSCV